MHFVLKRHVHAERIICVNDSYDQDYTIKDSERMLRQTTLPISNVFRKAEDKFPSSKDSHALLRTTAKNLTTSEDVPKLTCLHAEADTG